MKVFSFSLPEWTDRIYYPNSIIEQVTDFMFGSFAGTPEITRLRYGFLMQEVMDRFQAKIDSTLSPDRSLWIYSAHDISVGSVLKMLGLYVRDCEQSGFDITHSHRFIVLNLSIFLFSHSVEATTICIRHSTGTV